MRQPMEFRVDCEGASDDLIDYLARKSTEKQDEARGKDRQRRLKRATQGKTGPKLEPRLMMLAQHIHELMARKFIDPSMSDKKLGEILFYEFQGSYKNEDAARKLLPKLREALQSGPK